MSEQQDAPEVVPKAQAGDRQRSTIGFPYVDLGATIQLAKAIFENVAGGECDDDQLAAWTNQSAKSSGFRTQVYAGRTFGVLSGESGRHRVTELGKAVIDPHQEREAKVRAFLSVPLYAALFEKFKGGMLPPPAALEREIEGLGVAAKQKDRARQVFERCAEQAGFFEHGRNRLIQPGIAPSGKESGQSNDQSNKSPPGGGGGDGGTGDKLLDALISKLPAAGQTWSVDERVAWLSLMAMGFQITYGVEPTIEIKKANA